MAHGANSFQETAQLVVNLLPESDANLVNTVGSWSVTSGNATVATDADMLVFPGIEYSPRHSLRITPTDTNPVTLTVDNVSSAIEDRGDDFSFHYRIKSDRNVTAKTTLTRISSSDSTVREELCASNRWSIVRAEPIDIPQTTSTQSFSVEIEISGHEQVPLYLSLPVAYIEFSFTRNSFIRECVTLLPDVLLQKDSQQQFPSFPMARMMDVGLGYAGLSDQQRKHFRYRDIESGKDLDDVHTLSGMVEPDVVTDEFVKWLSQFSGITLLGSSTSTTAWGNLPTTWSTIQSSVDDIDAEDMAIVSISRDGSGTVTATVSSSDASGLQIGDQVKVFGTTDFDGTFTLTDVATSSPNSTLEWSDAGSVTTESSGSVTYLEWSEIEFYDVATAGLYEYWRWQLETNYNGYKAGTITSIEESAKYFLSGAQECRVTDHYGGDRWAIHIETLTSETPGGVVGTPSDIVLGAVALTVPAGFIVTHSCVASL